MTIQEAIHVLMLSPLYFSFTPPERLMLLREYCALFGDETDDDS